jgi:hypothetical protein
VRFGPILAGAATIAAAAVLGQQLVDKAAESGALEPGGGFAVRGLGMLSGPVMMAPDASRIVFAEERTRNLAIVDLRSGARATFPSPGNVSAYNSIRFPAPLAAWSRDGRYVWSSTRTLVGGGFAASPLRPVRVARGGAVRPLPALSSPAGPLDAIQWIGSDGLGLAQFGTGGGYYRPVHDDPAPELAIVDAARGRVLDRLPLSRIAAFRARKPGFSARANLPWASGTVLPDGRVAVLFEVNAGPDHRALVQWTQGRPPIEMPHPARKERWVQGALLPSGRAFLLTRELKPKGDEVICEIWSSDCPDLPPPTPRKGPLLQLRDAATGRVLWTLEATADRYRTGDVLQVAPEGDVALVSYPPAASTKHVALVRTRDGALLATLSAPGSDAGFTQGGRTIWVRAGNSIDLYRRN